jgi:hypothetical protein
MSAEALFARGYLANASPMDGREEVLYDVSEVRDAEGPTLEAHGSPGNHVRNCAHRIGQGMTEPIHDPLGLVQPASETYQPVTTEMENRTVDSTVAQPHQIVTEHVWGAAS